MAIKIASTVVHGGVQDSRVSGLGFLTSTPNATGGMVITAATSSATNNLIQLFNGTAILSAASNPFPWGLLIEPVSPFQGGGVSGDQQAGVGYDTLDYGRGYLYSAAHTPGNLFDVWDDGRNTTPVTVNGASQNTSSPLVLAPTIAWALGLPIFANANGLLDTAAAPAGGCRIGWVRGLTGSGPDLVVTIELALQTV